MQSRFVFSGTFIIELRLKKLNHSILVIVILISLNNIYAQSKKNASTSNRDSLLISKTFLQQEIKNYKSLIDSLKKISIDLDENIKKITKEIDDLYITKFGKENGSRILNKQIWKGMTDKMLQASWGKPDRIDSNKEKWGLFSQWYYGDVIFFFRDGKLTDWEETSD